jgi:hypothetical protein
MATRKVSIGAMEEWVNMACEECELYDHGQCCKSKIVGRALITNSNECLKIHRAIIRLIRESGRKA